MTLCGALVHSSSQVSRQVSGVGGLQRVQRVHRAKLNLSGLRGLRGLRPETTEIHPGTFPAMENSRQL